MTRHSRQIFFLEKITGCNFDTFSMRCYVSAFASSARSITFSLQAVLGNSPDFQAWYSEQQKCLVADPLARFFHEFRRVSQHIGDNPVLSGTVSPGHKPKYYFMPTIEIRNVPEMDVETACHAYLTTLIKIIYDCYDMFGNLIDPQQYFTSGNFSRMGKTIEDAEQELGFPRGWTDTNDPNTINYRWQALRDQAGSSYIAPLFQKYLGETIFAPTRLHPYKPSI
jgi:hypothetical protein